MHAKLDLENNVIVLTLPLTAPQRKIDPDTGKPTAKHALLANTKGWSDVTGGDMTVRIGEDGTKFRLRGSVLVGYKPEEPMPEDDGIAIG